MGSEYSTSQVTGSTFLPSNGSRIVDLRVQTAVFAVSVKPEVVVCRPEVVLLPRYDDLHQSFTDTPVYRFVGHAFNEVRQQISRSQVVRRGQVSPALTALRLVNFGPVVPLERQNSEGSNQIFVTLFSDIL